jgi:MYXO-CTERM domain-containing protein
MQNRVFLGLSLSAGLLASNAALGVVLVDYDFNAIANANQVSLASFSNDANVMPNGLTRGAGLTPGVSSAAKRYGSAGFDTGTTLNTALNQYVTWGFSAPSGNSAVVTDIRYVAARTGTTPAIGPQSAALFWTVDGGATLNAIGSTFAVTTGLGVQNLTGLSIPVASGETIEFRLYGWNAGGAAGELRLLDDNVSVAPKGIQVLGTSVPTPGALGLIGLSGLVALRRRR